MRIARFSGGDDRSGTADIAFGVVAAFGLAADADVAELGITRIQGHPFGPFELAGEQRPLADVRLVAPVLPSKVVAIGRNYAQHAAELGNDVPQVPIVFLKPSTAVVGPGEPIYYPPISADVHYEGELAVVIGRLCREVPAARWKDVVLGYTCANDVTARDLQRTEQQWGRAKGFDTFCPLGPWIETDIDPADVRITTRVNGELRQDGRTSEMVFGIGDLIEHVTAAMTLLPGDVILTGTPAGVGPLVVGDEVTVSIDGIGILTNRVVERG